MPSKNIKEMFKQDPFTNPYNSHFLSGLKICTLTRVTLLQSRAKTDQNWPNNLQVVEGVAGEKIFLI